VLRGDNTVSVARATGTPLYTLLVTGPSLGGTADEPNVGRPQILVGIEGDRRAFGQVMEPRIAQVAPPKHVVLAVLSQQRSHAPALIESRDRACHWCRLPGSPRMLLRFANRLAARAMRPVSVAQIAV
jgi:hypothetical protein